MKASLLLYDARQREGGRWLANCCCCSSLWWSCGRGRCYKYHSPLFRSSTLEEESDARGYSQRGSKRPPPRSSCIYQQALVSQHWTVLALSENKLPSTSNNKCQETKRRHPQQIRNAQKWSRKVGQTRRREKTNARIVAAAFLNAYPLCPGNNETRDQRRRRISVKISEGKRTRKRSTGPNVQPELTGYLGR